MRTVPLADDDPRVVAARRAEQRLFDHYGLAATDHIVSLPRLGLRVRVTEFGSGPPLLIVPGNTGTGTRSPRSCPTCRAGGSCCSTVRAAG